MKPPPPDAGGSPSAVQVARLDRPQNSGLRSPTVPNFRVQIAALRKEVDARRIWDRFQTGLGSMLAGVEPFFEQAETSNGIFYRVKVGPFQTRVEAQDLCTQLEQRDVTCFVVAHCFDTVLTDLKKCQRFDS